MYTRNTPVHGICNAVQTHQLTTKMSCFLDILDNRPTRKQSNGIFVMLSFRSVPPLKWNTVPVKGLINLSSNIRTHGDTTVEPDRKSWKNHPPLVHPSVHSVPIVFRSLFSFTFFIGIPYVWPCMHPLKWRLYAVMEIRIRICIACPKKRPSHRRHATATHTILIPDSSRPDFSFPSPTQLQVQYKNFYYSSFLSYRSFLLTFSAFRSFF